MFGHLSRSEAYLEQPFRSVRLFFFLFFCFFLFFSVFVLFCFSVFLFFCFSVFCFSVFLFFCFTVFLFFCFSVFQFFFYPFFLFFCSSVFFSCFFYTMRIRDTEIYLFVIQREKEKVLKRFHISRSAQGSSVFTLHQFHGDLGKP